MTINGGWNNDRLEHGYFDVDSVILPCSILCLNKALYDVLAGNTPAMVEYFADVTFGTGKTPLLNIDEIGIDRNIENVSGTCHIGFHTNLSTISNLIKGAEIIVTAGIRFDGVTASQKRFHGKIDQVAFPSLGQTRGTIDAYDNGHTLTDADCGASTLIGDALLWIANRCEALTLGDGFRMTIKTAGVTLANSHLLSYSSFSEAMKAVLNGFKAHYAFFSGMNELVILDPTTLSNEEPLFVLKTAGIQKLQETTSNAATGTSNDRVNQIPYSNYTGYSKNFVTYAVNVGSDGSSSISAVSIEGTGFISGVYNDTADQAIYPVLPLKSGIQNNICATDAELQAFCATVAKESQRKRINMDVGFNPFADLANVLQYDSSKYFISRIQDRIQAGQAWKTQMEVRSV